MATSGTATEQRAAPLLRVRLLGGFGVERDGGPAPQRWSRTSSRDLVKLLAVSPEHRLHREQVIETLWPDADPTLALRSLRVALHAASRALEPELAARAASSYLLSDGALLRLDPGTVWVDADHAERVATDALRRGDRRLLADALSCLIGELLPEDRYVAWALGRRDHLHDLQRRVQRAYVEALLEEGSIDEAIAIGRVLLDESPTDELAHRLLIEAFLRQGLRREAVRQYHRCREALDAELGIRPGEETERLHLRALTAGEVTATHLGVPVPAPLRSTPNLRLRGRAGALELLLDPEAPVVQLIGGEAGLGKTALVSEAARSAAEGGSAVLWGGGHASEGPTPYGAFVDALDAWLADGPPTERARVGAEFPELAAILPSLGLAGAEAERSPEEERERIFRAAAALLTGLAEVTPVLVVLDDMHEVDSGSFQLLAHLARRASASQEALRFLVTYRDEDLSDADARRETLYALERAGTAQRVDIDRLRRTDCDALVVDALGANADQGLLRQVWDLSLGNPLFALELARGIEEGGHEGADPRPPSGLRHLVAARLARLEPAARRVVEVVAVGGGEVALAEVLEVAAAGWDPGLSTAETTLGVDLAVDAAVLVERDVVIDGRPSSGLAFQHPLSRLTCYEQLSTARRQLLHGAFAETVLRRRPDAIDTLAGHLTRADDRRAIDYLRQAAERAAAICANDAADRYFVELTTRLDTMAGEADWARIDRSAVLERMGRYDDAAAVLREAAAELGRRGDEDGVVLATGRLAGVLARSRAAQEGIALLDVHRVGSTTSARAATAHHMARTLLCLVTGNYPEAVVAADRARASADRVEGPLRRGLVARALSMKASALALDGRFAEAGMIAAEALPHAEAFGDPQVLGTVLSVEREQARRSGRLREALTTGERALELARRSGTPAGVAFEQANLAEIHLLLEEIAEADELAGEAVEASRSRQDWSTPYALVAQARVQMRREDGDPADVLDAAARVADDLEDRQARTEVAVARAEWLVRTGDPDAALRLLGEHRASGTAHVLARAHLTAGRPERARDLAETEVGRAHAAGERIVETEALIVLAAAFRDLGQAGDAEAALDAARRLAEGLPYLAARRRIS